MKRAIYLLAAALAVAAAVALSAREVIEPLARRVFAREWAQFRSDPLPPEVIAQIYDMGVVDMDGNGLLDLYTSNHNYRQVLLRADGSGGFRDVLSAAGLDQDLELPGAEQSSVAPAMIESGLYVYWLRDTLHLVAHRVDGLGPVKGAVKSFGLVEVVANSGFAVEQTVRRPEADGIAETSVDFAFSGGNGQLALYLGTRGAPIDFRIDADWAKSKVFVGQQRVVPESRRARPAGAGAANERAAPAADCATCLAFSLRLRDRHAMAWADINDDGRIDVFISRGALGGRLRQYPDAIRSEVSDELLVAGESGRFVDRTRESGIEKKDCSGRHAKWVDFDRDGLLDLFINCQDRGHVAGGYPKQLYRQGTDGRFTDVAAVSGLDLPNNQLIDFAWIDVDGDGAMDLMTHEDEGFFRYRNSGGKFDRTFVCRGDFARSDVPGLKGNTSDYWQFDGKLTVADYDGNGSLDAFVASKKGNVLLVNERGTLRCVKPSLVGLPDESIAAAWVDYDNDGVQDLHVVPQGVFRQQEGGRFAATGLLALPEAKYQAAIINWFDRDNDGDVDVVVALLENHALWRWWERLYKSGDVKDPRGGDDRFDWRVESFRNVGADAHWLQLNLIGRSGNPQAIGATVRLATESGQQVRQVGAGEGANHSQGHYRLYFGVGRRDRVGAISIRWPDGSVQVLGDVQVDQVLTVRQER